VLEGLPLGPSTGRCEVPDPRGGSARPGARSIPYQLQDLSLQRRTDHQEVAGQADHPLVLIASHPNRAVQRGVRPLGHCPIQRRVPMQSGRYLLFTAGDSGEGYERTEHAPRAQE